MLILLVITINFLSRRFFSGRRSKSDRRRAALKRLTEKFAVNVCDPVTNICIATTDDNGNTTLRPFRDDKNIILQGSTKVIGGAGNQPMFRVSKAGGSGDALLVNAGGEVVANRFKVGTSTISSANAGQLTINAQKLDVSGELNVLGNLKSNGKMVMTIDQAIPGPAGPAGVPGAPGSSGPQGETGRQGGVGPRGPPGSKGETGAKGEKGDTGLIGPRGSIGEKGDKGDKGDQGEVGPIGPVGPLGPQGLQGDKGIQGEKGDKGDTGERGPIGVGLDNQTERVKLNRLQLGNKFLLSGVGDAHGNDDWLRVFDTENKGYHGGVAAGKLWTPTLYNTAKSEFHGNDNAFKGGVSEHNPNNWWSHLPWPGDNKNYIRGDTELRGNTNNIGDINVGRHARVNGMMIANGGRLNSPGRMHIDGGELLYILNKNGVVVGKEWGGNGNMNVQGRLSTNQDFCIRGTCINDAHLRMLTDGFRIQTLDNGWHYGAALHTHSDGVARIAGWQHRTKYRMIRDF